MPDRVLFLSNVPWDFVWQRHQTLAALWARRAAVDYVEIPGMRRPGVRDIGRILARARALMRSSAPRGVGGGALPDGLRIVRPWLLPGAGTVSCRVNRMVINQRLMKQPELRGPYHQTVIYTAGRAALHWLDSINAGTVIYDCTDDFTAVRGVPSSFEEDERGLLRRADLTVVPSEVLFSRKQEFARRIVRLPHGALVDRFRLPERAAPRDGQVTALYYGHLHKQHLDFAALRSLAIARPKWRLILIGPIRTRFEWPSNVVLPGQVRHDSLHDWLEQADVIMLPYLINRYTDAVMPAKSYECLATGRPIAAAPLPELTKRFRGTMHFVTDPAEWAEVIEQALDQDTAEARASRIALANKNTWEVRFEELLALVG